MSQDSKAKIEFLRMRLLKLKQSKESSENDGDSSGGRLFWSTFSAVLLSGNTNVFLSKGPRARDTSL